MKRFDFGLLLFWLVSTVGAIMAYRYLWEHYSLAHLSVGVFVVVVLFGWLITG